MASAAVQEADLLVLQAVTASADRRLFGAMKLQKLLFIAHHPREFDLKSKRPLRAFPFKVYKNGPFSEAIYASVERLKVERLLAEESRDTRRLAESPLSPTARDEGGPVLKVRVFTAASNAVSEVSAADANDRRVVREAVEKWGWLTGEQLEQLVLIRTGLTPALKGEFMGVEWSRFAKAAADRLPKYRPEPPAAYWRAQQQFLMERPRLIREHGKGRFVAYIGQRRVGIASDEIVLYKEVVAKEGGPPDYIGFLSDTGRPLVDGFGTS